MLSRCFVGGYYAGEIAEMGHPYPRKTRAYRGFGVQKQFMVSELYAHMDWEGKQVEWVVLLTS
jgi:hypothetical protein